MKLSRSMVQMESIDVDAFVDPPICIDLTGIDDASSTTSELFPVPVENRNNSSSKRDRRRFSDLKEGFKKKRDNFNSTEQPVSDAASSICDSAGEVVSELLVCDDCEVENSKGGVLGQDSDYDCIHAAYDINEPSLWKPINSNQLKIDHQFLDSLSALPNLPTAPVLARYCNPDMSNDRRYVDYDTWDLFKRARFRRPPLPRSLLPTKNVSRKVPLRNLRHTTSFKSAPGSIVGIVQCNTWIAICSSATGGHPDGPDETVDPYNREGAVMVWNGKLQSLSGHIQRRGNSVKQYSVNDIKFAPSRDILVSTGNDMKLNSWRYYPTTDSFLPWLNWKFAHVPRDIAFQPGGEALAVAERKLFIYSTILNESATETSFVVAPLKKKHNVGAMAWGRRGSATFIYASSEPDDESDLKGSHKAFDVQAGRPAYDFKETGAGDAIAITLDGTRLALITRHPERSHSLQIFDLRNNDPRPKISTSLSPFPKIVPGEINSATFSPDGIYLALGRNDNHTHIYDSRMLRKILFDYEHSLQSRINPGLHSFGIIQVEWVDGGALHNLPTGIVTGGNDGSLRYWNPFGHAQSSCNGTILAESSSDIASFSLGDCHVGERALVVGDCAGEVSIFDH